MSNTQGKKFSKWVSSLIWMLALMITLGSAIYQRKTGPTHPMRGTFTINGSEFTYKLVRDPTTDAPLQVAIPLPSTHRAVLYWREYPTDWDWKTVEMTFDNDHVSAVIPVQPSAGKVEYYIEMLSIVSSNTDHQGNPILSAMTSEPDSPGIRLPHGDITAIARYKDPVPAWALMPHILLMFIGMLLANRMGLGALLREVSRPELIMATFATLTVGGMIFGPIVQQYAFGAAWTGWPVGTDLTDNKMLISWIAWMVPVYLTWRKREKTALAVIIAALITFAIYMIPHSVLGSEHDYTQSETQVTPYR